MFALQMMIVTFLTGTQPPNRHYSFGVKALIGTTSLKKLSVRTKAQTHGPLRITGEVDVAGVWERQQKLFRSQRVTCPVRPTAPIFVALTTIPSRLADLESTINNLLLQTYPIDIFLSIPRSYSRFSASESADLHSLTASRPIFEHPRVHILKGADLGPGTKLLFPLSRLRGFDAGIIPVDDDQIYSPSLVCDLLVFSKMFPGKAITRRSRVFPKKHCSAYLRSSLVAEETVAEGEPRVYEGSDLVMGTSGYLVKTTFFDDSIFAFGACSPRLQDALFLNDDIWVSGHLKKNAVDIVVGLSGVKHTLSYTTSAPEIERRKSASGGLWADRSSTAAANRFKSLNAFFGAFCVPNRRTWGGKDSICRLHRPMKV